MTHVVTPGVNLEDDALRADLPNYLLALSEDLDGIHLAYCDATTGVFRITSLASQADAVGEIRRIQPREVLLRATTRDRFPALNGEAAVITELPSNLIGAKCAEGRLLTNLDSAGQREAASDLLAYLRGMHPTAIQVLREPVVTR